MRPGKRTWLALISPNIAASMAACARSAVVVLPTAMPSLCDMSVHGRWVNGSNVRLLILFGSCLPTLTQMQTSSYPATERLHDLTSAGASVVRLPVDFREEIPTFIPE